MHTPTRDPSKRMSMGPRPLQLGSGVTTPSSPSSTAGPSPKPPFSPTPLSRSNSTGDSPATSKRPVPKRLSSISYSTYSPSYDSSVASPLGPNGNPHSPAPQTPHLDKNSRRNTTIFTPTIDGTTAEDEKGRSDPELQVPPVLTLAEKHADLLSFIAQKESKCLEMRTQLEQHEAELKVLKRKWERIVSKSKPQSANGLVGKGGRDATGGGVVGGGEVVVEAIKEVGRFLGGLGVIDDPISTTLGGSEGGAPYPHQYSNRPGSSSSSPFTSPSPLATAAKLPHALPQINQAPEIDISPQFPSKATTSLVSSVPRSRNKRYHDHKQSPSRSSSVSSLSSSNPTASVTSTRDSLSSVSTTASSLDLAQAKPPSGGTTPTPDFQHPTPLPDAGHTGVISLDAGEPSSPGASFGWVSNGLNKKWAQISKAETFSRNSHRASVILSDMTDISSSILSSLSNVLSPPPSDLPSISQASQQASKRAGNQTLSPAVAAKNTTISLLDEEEEDCEISRVSTPVMLQTSPSPSGSHLSSFATTPNAESGIVSKPASSDDEWNW